MKIVIAGGSGLIGRKLIDKLLLLHHEVILLTRMNKHAQNIFPAVRVEFWDAKTQGSWTNIIDGSAAVINLTGAPIAAKRWTAAQKQQILSSRIDSTRAICTAIAYVKRKPSVLMNASAVGYYGNVPDGTVTEINPKGIGFLADVCCQWEEEALKAKAFGVRVVLMRTGIVLDKDGGALNKILLPFQFYVGGPLGSGRQWFPWIHVQDVANAIMFAMEHKKIAGPVNLAAPQSVRMAEFCKALGKILHRPSWLSIPGFVLKLALGEMAKPLLLEGQKVIPKKLVDAGFKFQFPKLEDALRDILA